MAFEEYSKYYDFLNQDKDYGREVEFVQGIIRKNAPSANTILELGCGTGRHASLLATKGYKVVGIDISETMLDAARTSTGLKISSHQDVEFIHGDIRNIQLDRKFDVIVSLFHVMSYQTKNTDIKDVLRTARNHLEPNGIFIFDFWYGPGVLTDKPSVCAKYFENDEIKITRISEPEMYPNNNSVDINFRIFIMNKSDNKYKEIKEIHKMRYLFQPELKMFLEEAGFELVEMGEWLTLKKIGFDTWNGFCTVIAV